MKKIYLLSIFFINFCLAQPNNSGPFRINGGNLPPGTTPFQLDLDNLPNFKNPSYDIQCDIINQNYDSSPVVIKIAFGDISTGVITINNKIVNPATFQSSLDQQINKLQIKDVSFPNPSAGYKIIYFYNYDTTHALTFKNCQASYA